MTVEEISAKLTEYAQLVENMRTQQKLWFDGKWNYNALKEAKQLEKRVDQATSAILQPKPQSQQKSLFDK